MERLQSLSRHSSFQSSASSKSPVKGVSRASDSRPEGICRAPRMEATSTISTDMAPESSRM